jgi:TatA/E family protein of Tat protein translocase
MMNRMSFSETIFLFFLALIIFGPKKLPEIARTVGKALNEFRRASNEFKAQIEQEIAHLEVEKTQTILPPTPSPEGTASRTLTAAPIEASPSETPVTSAKLEEDEPLFATRPADLPVAEPPVPAESVPTSDAVSASTSQESHV